MTKKIKDLLKSKEYIENRIELDSTLLQTIQQIKQDETKLQDEIQALKTALKLIKKELRIEYKTK
jgi:hypothetical protein